MKTQPRFPTIARPAVMLAFAAGLAAAAPAQASPALGTALSLAGIANGPGLVQRVHIRKRSSRNSGIRIRPAFGHIRGYRSRGYRTRGFRRHRFESRHRATRHRGFGRYGARLFYFGSPVGHR